MSRMISAGYGNMVASERVLAVVGPDSSPVRRMIQEQRESGRVIDATCGHRTRSVLVMDSGHLLLCALQPETISGRIEDRHPAVEE